MRLPALQYEWLDTPGWQPMPHERVQVLFRALERRPFEDQVQKVLALLNGHALPVHSATTGRKARARLA